MTPHVRLLVSRLVGLFVIIHKKTVRFNTPIRLLVVNLRQLPVKAFLKMDFEPL